MLDVYEEISNFIKDCQQMYFPVYLLVAIVKKNLGYFYHKTTPNLRNFVLRNC